jgi:hypothetical protein
MNEEDQVVAMEQVAQSAATHKNCCAPSADHGGDFIGVEDRWTQYQWQGLRNV